MEGGIWPRMVSEKIFGEENVTKCIYIYIYIGLENFLLASHYASYLDTWCIVVCAKYVISVDKITQ